MNKRDRIEAREASRVLLIEARRMSSLARDKLMSVYQGNHRLGDQVSLIIHSYEQVIRFVVEEQGNEK